MRILIAPDKFKGTLSAREAADFIYRGWNSATSGHKHQFKTVPISDGGDGFGSVLADCLSAELRTFTTVDAAHRPRTCSWWWKADQCLAIIETAEVIGLALLPHELRKPLQLDTSGLGKLITHVTNLGARSILLGIGGSATNDAGFGFAKEIGWKFLDSAGCEIERWIELDRLATIVPPPGDSIPSRLPQCTIAVDVQNPLLGPLGASRIYGPQKGLLAEQMTLAEAALDRLAKISKSTLGHDLAALPGTGAAGGLGFGLTRFLNGRLEPGFEMVAKAANLTELVEMSDLIITGEGALDDSTAMGKGAGQLAKLCKSLGKPCVGLAGYMPPNLELLSKLKGIGFASAYSICPNLTEQSEAIAQPGFWLEKLASHAARHFSINFETAVESGT